MNKTIKPVKVAVFPVAGLGTRFLPATKSIPKEMLTIVDKPLIQYAFEEAQKAGIERFVFITGRNKDTINNHFDNAYELQDTLIKKGKNEFLDKTSGWIPEPGSIAYIRQQEPKGLGHAIYCARNFIGDNAFAVILPDEMMVSKKPFLKEMVEKYNNIGGNVIGVADVNHQDTEKYGIIEPLSDKNGVIDIASMVEKPEPKDAPSNIAITGPYILQPEIFEYLASAKKGQGGEIQITDSINKMIENYNTSGVRFTGKRYDCGNRKGFLTANIACALENPEMKDDMLHILQEFITEYRNTV